MSLPLRVGVDLLSRDRQGAVTEWSKQCTWSVLLKDRYRSVENGGMRKASGVRKVSTRHAKVRALRASP